MRPQTPVRLVAVLIARAVPLSGHAPRPMPNDALRVVSLAERGTSVLFTE